MTNQEAASLIQYRIDTVSEIVGKGLDGKGFQDLEFAVHALQTIDSIQQIILDSSTISEEEKYIKIGDEISKYLQKTQLRGAAMK